MHELNDSNKIQNCPIPAAHRVDLGALVAVVVAAVVVVVVEVVVAAAGG